MQTIRKAFKNDHSTILPQKYEKLILEIRNEFDPKAKISPGKFSPNKYKKGDLILKIKIISEKHLKITLFLKNGFQEINWFSNYIRLALIDEIQFCFKQHGFKFV